MRDASGLSQLALPSGGGGIAPLGDRFQPDLVRGTGNYSVPLPCPKGPNDLQPRPVLTYSTGSGNGPFGLGWRCEPLRIERRSDRGVPTFDDSDEFTVGGAEVLVPVGGGRYRPRTETQFWYVERLAGDAGWRLRDGSGHTQLLGTSEASRESGPAGEVFAWHLEEETDPAGNTIRYEYLRDGGRLYLAAIRWSIWAIEVHHQARPDVLRNARAGFLRTTGLRVEAIDLTCTRTDPAVLRTWSLRYEQAANGVSQLQRVELSAGEGADRIAHPALTFAYTAFDLADAQVDAVQAELPPPSLDTPGTQLVDLDGDGLPDVLELTGSSALSWRNTGEGSFAGPFRLDGLPSLVALTRGNVALADLDGDGRADLFATDQPLSLAFHADGHGGFDPSPTVFAQRPSTRLSEPETRLTDLDGDGVTDLLWTGPQALVGFRHVPGEGWSDPDVMPRIHDLDTFPDVRFGDRGVRLGDMTGDGLADIVVVRSGEVSFWPSLGHGSYGPRIDMSDPPRLPPGYRESALHLMDVDGDGCADVVYLGDELTTVWLNRSGNGFAPPVHLPIAPPPGRPAHVADIFGDGRPGLVWTNSSKGVGDSGYRVLRFGAGQPAPYLLANIDNGMGGRSDMAYATSTAMRVADAADGRAWSNLLPIPVHVLSSLAQVDTVTGRVSTTRMRYHDGIYDGRNREFRGFRAVTVETVESDASIPAARQEVEFFQGDPDELDLVERARQRALAGSSTSTAMYEQVGDTWELRQRSDQVWDARLEHEEGPLRSVWFPHVATIDTREIGAGDPDRMERLQHLDIDGHGNVRRQVRRSWAEGDPAIPEVVTEERTTYLDDEARWLVRLPVRTTALDGAGVTFTARISRYDGPAFEGLPEGSATTGQTTNVIEGRLFDARTPAGLLDRFDPATLGYRRVEGDSPGWYAVATSVRRDGRGNVIEQRDPLGAATLLEYDGDGVFPVSATDPAGRSTRLDFEPRAGEPARTTYADGRVGRAEYDGLGRLMAIYEIDDTGSERLTKAWATNTGAVPTTTTSYAPAVPVTDRAALLAADPLALARAGTSVSRVFHDGLGNSLATATTAPPAPAGPSRVALTDRVVLNGRGMVATQLAPEFAQDLSWPGAPTAVEVAALSSHHTHYDATGVVVESVAPGGARFVVERDAFTILHREGGPGADVTRTERFDPRGRLVVVEEVVGDGTLAVAGYDLDFDGRVRILRDSAGAEVARWEHAGPGDPARISHRDAGTRDYVRDAAGRLVEMTEADGLILRYDFDALGRVIAVDSVVPGEGAPDVVTRVRSVFYDADPDPAHPSDGRFLTGRVAVIEEAGNTFRWTYDRAGRPLREEQEVAGVVAAVDREYDVQGRLSALTYPDGTRVAYDLDPTGAVVRVPGFADDLDYGADGLLRSYLADNGARVEVPRDEATGRQQAVRATAPGGTLLRGLEYAYDTTGSITRLVDIGPAGTESSSFGYDGLHRLETVTVRTGGPAGAAIRSHEYTYDDAGNLQHYGDVLPVDLAYGDAARPGRVTGAVGGGGAPATPLVYGPRGEVTATGSLTGMTYDALARLLTATAPAPGGNGSVQVRFAYDPQGRRVLKEVESATGTTRTRSLAGLWEASDSATVRHMFLGTQLLASVTTPTGGGPALRLMHVCDHHGTVLASIDDECSVVAWQRYSPFGAALETGQALDRYLGREPDVELALLQLGARFLDPALGRFLAPDWYILEHPDKAVRLPQGFAVYAYALNNPLSFKDPSGLWFGIDDLIVAAVGFVVGFVSGLIYGLVNGQGWGSLLTALETGLTTAAGAWLGWNIAGPFGAVMGGMNGLIGGIHGIYDWSSPAGWFAFLSDSTWSLLGTSIGNIVHIINLFYKDANYRDDLSRRQNRNVYEGGFALKKDFAFTQGNVISNAGQGTGTVNASFIANHEELHVWQQRIFGPLFQATYVVWAVGGLLVGSIVWLWHTDTGASGLGSLIETAAYYDNPFEYWAYKNDNNWPPSGANRILTY